MTNLKTKTERALAASGYGIIPGTMPAAKTPNKIGFGLSGIDEDEWSWSVEQLRDGETTWGIGSSTLASGCEYTKSDAVAAIKTELAKHGLTIKTAVQLPF